jgi:hypothetical protein
MKDLENIAHDHRRLIHQNGEEFLKGYGCALLQSAHVLVERSHRLFNAVFCGLSIRIYALFIFQDLRNFFHLAHADSPNLDGVTIQASQYYGSKVKSGHYFFF